MSESEAKWGYVFSSIVVTAVGHPIEYAKVLIQLGHEPIPPRPAKTLLGKPVLSLPNVFRYVGYIKKVDGVSGCFRGLSAKLTTSVTSCITMELVREHLEKKKRLHYDKDDDDETRQRKEFFDKLSIELIANAAGVAVSQPFYVISIRMMAEFIGGENKYSTILAAIREIYSKEGILGFFNGFFPRLFGHLLYVTLTAVFGAIIIKCLPESEEVKNYAVAASGFVASAITYPFHLVSNCMAVTSSGLVAGSPPYMPEYRSWTHCWGHLYRTNNLKRGSSLLWRHYKGPYMFINGQPVMLNKDEFITSAKLRD